MADTPTAATAPSSDASSEAQKTRDEWFTTTPDPWIEIARLDYGGDRSFATTVERLVRHAEPAQHAELETKLLAVLARAELTEAARALVCRMLGLIGSAASVPAVAALSQDDRTADDARRALDFIPSAAVDEAYRTALGKLSGAAKAGLIGSIATRGDRAAAAALAAIAADAKEPADVRTAAVRAAVQLEGGR